jgi:hypothetical protein
VTRAVSPAEHRELLLARLAGDLRWVAGESSTVDMTPALQGLFKALRDAASRENQREVAILSRRLPELGQLHAAGFTDDQLRWIAPIRVSFGGSVSQPSEFEGIRIVRVIGGTYGLLIRA